MRRNRLTYFFLILSALGLLLSWSLSSCSSCSHKSLTEVDQGNRHIKRMAYKFMLGQTTEADLLQAMSREELPQEDMGNGISLYHWRSPERFAGAMPSDVAFIFYREVLGGVIVAFDSDDPTTAEEVVEYYDAKYDRSEREEQARSAFPHLALEAAYGDSETMIIVGQDRSTDKLMVYYLDKQVITAMTEANTGN